MKAANLNLPLQTFQTFHFKKEVNSREKKVQNRLK